MKIVIITASEKKNLELAQSFQNQLKNTDVSVINLVDLDLPLYTSRADEKYKAPDLLGSHYQSILDAKGLVFIAPEYNGSTPPVFNNFLAWLSRSTKNWRESLNGKPAVIATFSGGGGFHVLHAMRSQLSFIGMNVLGRQILTHPTKALDDKSLEAVCSELVKLAQASK